MKKSISAGLFFALLIFISAAMLSIVRIADQRHANDERTKAFAVAQKLETVLDGIMNVETAWANYTQTKEPRYLAAYNAAIEQTIKSRDELKNIYSGPHANRRFEELSTLIDSRINVLKEIFDSVMTRAAPEIQVEILRTEERIHNELLLATLDLEGNETSKIVALDAEIERLSKQSIYSLLAGALFCVVIFSALFYLLYRELQQRKRLEQAIKRQAHFDQLTGLPNRIAFSERLAYELTQAGRSRQRSAILFLDIDHFKEINDSLGHEAGDEFLKEVAGRLRANVRESDTIARIGGDEFNILLTNISDTESVSRIAEKVIDSFQQPFAISGQEIRSSTSIGISIYPEDGENAAGLVKYADIAMYHAKEQGRNNFKFYNPGLNSRIWERALMENNLRHTLEKNEMVLHYQPQIDVRRKRIECVEALVRWKHPVRGILNPLDFIPLAEAIGFIFSLDEWVLRTACAQVKASHNGGSAARCLTVNLSSREFRRPELVTVISRILAETAFDPRCLELEISEQAAMEDIGNTAAKLQEFRSLGVTAAIDHFGAGYSSLTNLKMLSLHRIKIDRSFIEQIASSRKDRAIVRAIIVMAHNMDIRVVAEGVETPEQMRFLEADGCDEAQGYHVCGPLPLEDFTKFAASYESGPVGQAR